MKTVDISPLIPGLLKVILFAIAIGQFDNLRTFARREFVRSLSNRGWHEKFQKVVDLKKEA